MESHYLVAFNRTRGRFIASKVLKADDYQSRSRGLLGRAWMSPEEGLWIVPCPMIHTLCMQFVIDVIFLDRKMSVVRVIEDMKPWRLSPWVFRAYSVLELAGGSLKGGASANDLIEIQ